MLDAGRVALAAQVRASAQARDERQVVADCYDDANERLDELVTEHAMLVPDIYLMHRRHIQVCNERLQAADSTLTAACLKEQACREQVEASQRRLAAIDASLEACRELYHKLLEREAAREEARLDEEAGEVAAARRHRATTSAREPDHAALDAAEV
jgi:hypothetical protein